MKFSLLLTELKVFTRAITSLGKLGDDIFFECSSDELSIRCVNSTRSAFAVVSFSGKFFEKNFRLTDSEVRFKLNTKTCCKVFKQTMAWDKTLHRCKIRLDNEQNRLVVQFFQRHGIVKTYNLPIIECESLEAIYDIENSTCQIAMSSKVAGEIMQNFRQNQTEVTISMQIGECIFRNYVEQSDVSSVNTHIPVPVTEFEAYRLTEECDITFCQKDFRAALLFGESVNALLVLNCSQPGNPMILTFTDEKNYKAHFVLSTLPLPYVPKRVPLNSTMRPSESALPISSVSFLNSDESHGPANGLNGLDTMTAPTQILPSSSPNLSSTVITANTPIPVREYEEARPPAKKARSVLFASFMGGESTVDSFFHNPPPPQKPERLYKDAFENSDLDDATMVDALSTHEEGAGSARVTARLASDVRTAAVSGWNIADNLQAAASTRKSGATLLVPDSDDES
nr:cell cycle checkpoint control protein rad9a [Hymenolepis microstoma]